MSAEISVVMCTFNGSKFLLEQLQSIELQTLTPSEIIISDDCSTDDTLDILKNWKLQKEQECWSPSILIIENKSTIGVVRNFEQAINKASCELIALCDQDDLWLHDKLAKQASFFEQQPNLLLTFSDSILVDEKSKPQGLSSFEVLGVTRKEIEQINSGKASQVLIKRNIATGATMMFRKKITQLIFPVPNFWLHDEWIALASSFIGPLHCSTHPSINYRQHENNVVGLARATLKKHLGRIFYPGKDRNSILFSRSQVLKDHRLMLSLSQENNKFIYENFEHEAKRAMYSPNRFLRTFQVLREISSGRYFAYSLGAKDIIRDFFQPNK